MQAQLLFMIVSFDDKSDFFHIKADEGRHPIASIFWLYLALHERAYYYNEYMSDEREREAAALKLKEEGNIYFKAKNYNEAINKYT